MSKTGSQFVDDALKEIQVLDPTATASAEQLSDALRAGCDLLDTWRTKRLLISGITISTYNLASGTQSYTIGSGGAFSQTYPHSIERWSVIPDDDATDPVEIDKGRPVTDEVWQALGIKTQTGAYPTVMYFDRSYAAGLGACLFHPIPDNNDVDVKLYTAVPAITTLVAATTYDLKPGMQNLLTLELAITLFGRYGKAAVMTESLQERHREARAAVKVANIVPKPSPIRPEYIIGQGGGRRTFNVYNGS